MLQKIGDEVVTISFGADMHRTAVVSISAAALAGMFAVAALARASRADEAPLLKRESFANAHLLYMVRAESQGRSKMADVELWADGARLRARIAPPRGVSADEVWVDGLASEALLLHAGHVAQARPGSIEEGLQRSLRPAPELGNSKNDRVAGHPCKVVSEELPEGGTLTRCLWRGIPLSVELRARGHSFNAAATLVEEGQVSVADLQPPAGAPDAARGLSATR